MSKLLNTLLYLGILIILILKVQAFYGKHYRKCALNKDYKQMVENMEVQRIPKYNINATFQLASQYHRKPIQFLPQKTTFIYNKYLGHGVSGQVYLIDIQKWTKQNGKNVLKTQKKVCKRFFQEDLKAFEQQNYLMQKLDYDVKWFKEYQPFPYPQQKDLERKPTLALYPHLNAVSMKDVDIEGINIPMLFYKIARQLEKAHQVGIIHNDIKMGNILVIRQDKSIKAQLIDWNLATFYYPGYFAKKRKGAIVYMAPQSLLKNSYPTPASDIYSLGLTFYKFLTQKSPSPVLPSKKTLFKAFVSLHGLDDMINLLIKYNLLADQKVMRELQTILNQPKKYKAKPIIEILKKQAQQDKASLITDEFLDLLSGMLHPDPQQRLTIQEVLNHKYFNKVRKLPFMMFKKMQAKGIILPSKPKQKPKQVQINIQNQSKQIKKAAAKKKRKERLKQQKLPSSLPSLQDNDKPQSDIEQIKQQNQIINEKNEQSLKATQNKQKNFVNVKAQQIKKSKSQ